VHDGALVSLRQDLDHIFAAMRFLLRRSFPRLFNSLYSVDLLAMTLIA
jgi:hypothetical protein